MYSYISCNPFLSPIVVVSAIGYILFAAQRNINIRRQNVCVLLSPMYVLYTSSYLDSGRTTPPPYRVHTECAGGASCISRGPTHRKNKMSPHHISFILSGAAQGFLFSRPFPRSTLVGLVEPLPHMANVYGTTHGIPYVVVPCSAALLDRSSSMYVCMYVCLK